MQILIELLHLYSQLANKMTTEKKSVGRPIVKPKRTQTAFALNNDLFDKVGLLRIKLNESSLNDVYNRVIIEAIQKYKI